MLVVKWSELVEKFFTITATKVDVRKRNETKSSQLMPFIFETSVRTEGHREKLQEYKTETYLSKIRIYGLLQHINVIYIHRNAVNQHR